MTVVMERESAETLSVLITTDDDPTSTPVEFAFLPIGQRPAEGDWQEGEWTGESWQGKDHNWRTWVATPTIGATPLDLAVGVWQGWVRIQDAPEAPVWRVDRVRIV
jgi:hypothetical protein